MTDTGLEVWRRPARLALTVVAFALALGLLFKASMWITELAI